MWRIMAASPVSVENLESIELQIRALVEGGDAGLTEKISQKPSMVPQRCDTA